MWNILTEKAIGLIILINHAANDPIADLDFFIRKFEGFVEKHAIVIGITQMDLSEDKSIGKYYEYLKNNKIIAPCFSIDARKKQDVSLLIKSLIFDINPLLK